MSCGCGRRLGFTPGWYGQELHLDFGERFHTDPVFRRDSVWRMRTELRQRFPATRIGRVDQADRPLDLLTGTYGGCTVAAIYGLPILYAPDRWPDTAPAYLTDEQVDRLEPPDLERNPHFQRLMEQVEWIEEKEWEVDGFINWQGVFNNALRLRGEQLLLDLKNQPDRARHLLACVGETMAEGIQRLHRRQRAGGTEVRFVAVNHSGVNRLSPQVYEEFLLPLDQRLAEVYGSIGLHHCANGTAYLRAYAEIPGVAYLDQGLDSDWVSARRLFSEARRGVIYPPAEAVNKSWPEIEADFHRIATECAPCDIVIADLGVRTPYARAQELIALCQRLSEVPTAG